MSTKYIVKCIEPSPAALKLSEQIREITDHVIRKHMSAFEIVLKTKHEFELSLRYPRKGTPRLLMVSPDLYDRLDEAAFISQGRFEAVGLRTKIIEVTGCKILIDPSKKGDECEFCLDTLDRSKPKRI